MRFPFALTPQRDASGPYYADIYPRAVAAGVDLLILYSLLADLFNAMGARFLAGVDSAALAQVNDTTPPQEFYTILWQSHFLPLWLANSFFQLALLGAMLVGCQLLWGTTPGKWLLGIKIVRYGTTEAPVWWRMVVRFLAYIPAVLPLMIGIFWISFNRERRGWHDYIAGTAVLNLRPHGWYIGQIKAFYRRLRPVKQPVSEPAAGERHQDGH